VRGCGGCRSLLLEIWQLRLLAGCLQPARLTIRQRPGHTTAQQRCRSRPGMMHAHVCIWWSSYSACCRVLWQPRSGRLAAPIVVGVSVAGCCFGEDLAKAMPNSCCWVDDSDTLERRRPPWRRHLCDLSPSQSG
jgi:hypothetical protein